MCDSTSQPSRFPGRSRVPAGGGGGQPRLPGTDTRSAEIVEDAVQMLSKLVDDVLGDATDSIGPQTMPILAVDEVEALLDRAERVS